jgi:ABC-type Fe3+ transport system permease subunit
MKNYINATTVIPGVIVATALLLSFRSFSKADIVVGFGAVVVLLAIATLEYRLNWKRLLGL